jgi:hypothetical protein
MRVSNWPLERYIKVAAQSPYNHDDSDMEPRVGSGCEV